MQENTMSSVKTLWIKWLYQAFCPASDFVPADRDEARVKNFPWVHSQCLINVIVSIHCKKE
jgi:hypothetical protein